jgi:hypothetical protein
MHDNAATRLVEQQLSQRVVARECLHLLKDGVAGRSQDTTNDDVADLSARVASDDCN